MGECESKRFEFSPLGDDKSCPLYAYNDDNNDDDNDDDAIARRLVTWMQKTLMLSLDEAVREAALWEVDKPREEWLFGFPAELALLAGQVKDEASSFSMAIPTLSSTTCRL